jgi:hypothetical protein
MTEPRNALRTVAAVGERDYVEFWPAGAVASGRFRCTACGNASHVKFVLPRCQSCGERLWERDESGAYTGGGVAIR